MSEIGAKTVYPIHTEHAVMFNKVSENRVLIDEGKNTIFDKQRGYSKNGE